MGPTGSAGEPEASDDSISLTSTVASAEAESYEVECILAERNTRGAMRYLTAWKHYPEDRHEWTPREYFNEDDVFSEWTRTKMRIAQGLEKPFDVKAWTKMRKQVKIETQLRRERRRKKKLRLSNQQVLNSRPGEHDASTESSGSEPAERRSDKRIKRRSVHQDSPPSSSISDPSSTSNSEDSDRPLLSRQESEISIPNCRWTQAETIALEEGLRTLKGPRWRDILGLYGRNGTTSQVLKGKTASDLYDKAKSVRQEFVDSGKEPPEYLKPISKAASSKGSGSATPRTHSESRGQSRAASKRSSRSTSADSMMAKLHEKQRMLEAKHKEKSRPQQTTSSTEILNPARPRQKESNTANKTSRSKIKVSQASQAPARKARVALAKTVVEETQKTPQNNPHLKNPIPYTKGTVEVRKSSEDNLLRERKPEDGPRAKEPSNISANAQPERQQKSQAPSEKQTARPATDAAVQLDSSRIFVPEATETVREEKPPPTSSGTAGSGRAPTTGPLVSKTSRLGAEGSGSSHSNSSKPKLKLGQIEPKKPNVNGDVTAAWNAEPKRRKSNNWATTNADPMDGQAPKRTYKLSVQNRIYKSRREGRAPDPDRLVFIDPKTGKAPTTLSAPLATMMSKAPLQLHQEGLARREVEEREPRGLEDAVHVTTSEPDPQPQREDLNGEIRIDEQMESEINESKSNTSASALRPMAGDTTDGPAPIDRVWPLSSASPRPGPPGIPIGHRIETKRMASMSLQDYTKRSMSSTQYLHETLPISHQPFSSDDPSNFTLRNYPSWEEENDIFNKQEFNLVIGDIKLGKDDEESMKIKLVGFNFEIKNLLLTVKSLPRTVHFVFDTVLLASEYQAYFPAEPSDYLGSGSIVPYPASKSAIENITETLANNLQGSIFFAQQYTMLMYPAGASAWACLDNKLPKVHLGTTLRFVVRRPLPSVPADVHRLATDRLIKRTPERYAEITTKVKKYPIQAEAKNINIVFRDMFEIDFSRLVAQNGPQQHPPSNIFFLCFIPQGCEDYEPDPAKRAALRLRTSEEHDLFIKFLQANGAEEIYSMQNVGSQEIENNGAWDYWLKNVKSGTIIFHDAYIRYDLVRRLGKHLMHGSVNVWKTSLSPMHPGEKHPHLVRLFPHGGVLLLTESLILYYPRETLRTLMWFRLYQKPLKAPGTWKLAVRPRVREWLLDIMDAYSDSGKEIFGCSMQIFADIYTEIWWLLQTPDPGDNGLMCYAWDYETPTDEAPIVSSSSLRALQARREWKGTGADIEPDDNHIRQNDDLLVQWFAEWAIVNLHNYRKYNVILGYTKDHPFTAPAISAYEKAYGHIEVMTFAEAFIRHKVTPQSKLDEKEAKRRKELKEELPAKKAAAEEARKEERKAAKAALKARIKAFRDLGATEEEAMRAGRQLLRDLGGSEKEIEECQVDMDRVFADRWWEEPVKDGEVKKDQMDTREADQDSKGTELALPRTPKYLADRERARMTREASAAGNDRVQSMDTSG